MRTLLALAKAGSLGAAAKSLGVNKTTIGRHLQALEDRFGVAMVHFDGGRYALTDEGTRAARTAEQMAGALERLDAELATLRETVAGTVRITAPVFFTQRVVIPELHELRDAYPGLNVEIVTTAAVLEIGERSVDIAVRNTVPSGGELVRRRAGRVTLALYASPRYLARRPVPSTRGDLADHTFVGLEHAVAGASCFAWLNELEPPVAFRASDIIALGDAARAGLGIALLPCLLAEDDAELTRLEVAPPAAEDIYLVMPTLVQQQPRVRAVADWLIELFARHDTELNPFR